MTTKAMLAALAMCCTTAMADHCDTKKSDCATSCETAVVQTVSNDSDCTKSCDGAAVQTVSNETKGDCEKSCDGAAVQTVSNDSDCAKSCDGAAVQTVANESKGDCSSAKSCDVSGAAVQTVAYGDGEQCSKACPLEAAMPVMLMKVGNETTQCSVMAKDMCDKSGSKMSYVVNDKEYECSVMAKEAHHVAMKDMLASMTHVSFNVDGNHTECPVGAKIACKTSGEAMKYQVGTVVFDSAEEAIQAAAMARAAISQVAMSYEVAGEATHCSTAAEDMASTCSSKSVTYVVNDKKTECSKSAEFNLVEAQLMAAIDGVRKSMS